MFFQFGKYKNLKRFSRNDDIKFIPFTDGELPISFYKICNTILILILGKSFLLYSLLLRIKYFTPLLFLVIACGETSSSSGFDAGIDPNATLEGTWNSTAYDFSQTNTINSKLDSVFSFTGPILQERYQGNGQRLRTFLGFTENYTYSRVANEIKLARNGDTMTAKIKTLTATHFAYTIEHRVMINDTLRYQFTSAQLTR